MMSDLDKKKKNIMSKINKFLETNKIADKRGVKIGFLSDDKDIGVIERLPTGILGFDILTGGGLVKGKINQIYGPEGCTKTTLTLKAIANCQKIDPMFIAAYLNNEKTFDRDWAAYNGVDPQRLLVADVTTGEESADLCNHLSSEENEVDFAAFDTIQALSTKTELGKSDKKKRSVGDKTMADIPRMYSQFLRMYTSQSAGTLTLLLASQVRMDLGSFIPTATATGGNAIKHYNILTVEMRKGGKTHWPSTEIPPKSFTVCLKIKIGRAHV